MTIAIDFDGTMCEERYPDIGEPRWDVINYINMLQKSGDKVILWTCRKGKRLKEAVKWCEEKGIIFDAVNKNLKEHIKKYHNDTRKIFADIYIDDKAMKI